jgi:hypothetical protein
MKLYPGTRAYRLRRTVRVGFGCAAAGAIFWVYALVSAADAVAGLGN